MRGVAGVQSNVSVIGFPPGLEQALSAALGAMAMAGAGGLSPCLHRRFTKACERGGCTSGWEAPVTGLALMMFIGLFAFGGQLLGWQDTGGGQIQLGLFMSFLFGIICGYRTRS